METDEELVSRFGVGNEDAFVSLVSRYNASLLRLARVYVPSDAVAEEVVQETWIGVVRGLDRFEGRSSLKTWLYCILVNRARSAGRKERSHLPVLEAESAVDRSRFDPSGAWTEPLESWADADDRLVAGTWSKCLIEALEGLPRLQREIVMLRDVEGMASKDVCEVFGISQGNQRVLLHRGRSRLRSVLETELGSRSR
jgi:RNA polymerase sigma-70 factor (ECF subfamily)